MDAFYIWDGNTWKSITNIKGPKGDKGDKGDDGAAGGAANQIMKKNSAADFDFSWSLVTRNMYSYD
jgi:hypothetical protein